MRNLFLLVLLISTSAFAKTTDLSWMRLRAHTKAERNLIANVGVSIEAVREDFVAATGTPHELSILQRMGVVELSFPIEANKDFPQEDASFHDYARLTVALRELEKTYPEIVKMSSIGKSVEGRDIWALRISGNLSQADQLPAVIFLGGHHAREHVSVETPLGIWTNLLARYAQGDQRVKNLIDARDIHLIPAVNPDGLEYDVESGSYRMWRKNRTNNGEGIFGVDLNRNYGFEWGTGGSSAYPGSDVYRGPTPFSEPETRAIRDYIEKHVNITSLLSFHTYSELILYPWGYQDAGISIARDKAVHETMAKKMAEWNHYTPQQSSELYISSGDTTDWSYGVHRIISFTFELDPASLWGGGGFYPGAGVIPDVIEKNTEPVLYMLDLADNPYRSIDGLSLFPNP